MTELPSGTVTFLFTDIEGSTTRWEHQPEAMRVALARHDTLLRTAIVEHGGHVVKTMGDAFHAVFSRAPDAVSATLDAQRRLQAEPWGEIGLLRVRMALHTGEAEERDGDYYGPPLNRAARLMSAGHGGQVLLSQATCQLVRDTLPEGTSLVDLGEHRLKDLIRSERIFQVADADVSGDFPPLRTLDARPNNLPVQTTPLLGREHEVADARERLLHEDVRILTLTGPGGTGKSRLALQVAADLIDDFRDGACFVALAPITDPGLVLATIAQALEMRDVGGRPILDSLKDYLRHRTLLLVLDNFEQVLSAASAVGELLGTSSGLKVLVTSRAPLELRGEQELPVPPLDLPDPRRFPSLDALIRYAAVALFVERATAIRPDFVVTDENARAVAEICVRLDGLPLAIELAAARTRLLSPQAMLARLERRLPLLTGGAQDLPSRQRTLRDAIAWSYDLLTPDEQHLFRQLGAFVGGFTLDAAESISTSADDPEAEVLDGLASLVAKSLVRRNEREGGESRFDLLETIREYALERLEESGEADPIRGRHAAMFLALSEAAAPELEGANQVTWLDRLDAEHDNLRAALAWSQATGDAKMGLRLASALVLFWDLRGHVGEGRTWLEAMLAPTSSHAFTAAHARAASGVTRLAMITGDFEAARRFGDAAVTSARGVGDRRVLGRALFFAGAATFYVDRDAARPLYEEAISILRDTGDAWGLASAVGPRGADARASGEYAASYAHHREAAELFRRTGDRRGLGLALIGAALALRLQDNVSDAAAVYRQALRPLHEVGDRWMLSRALEGFAAVCCLQNEHQRSARLYGAAKVLRETISAPVLPSFRPDYDDRVADVRAALGNHEFATAWAEGRAMSSEQAVTYALEWSVLT
jgi:predicted ATPase/class 3 adenylate cyclase